MTMTTTPSTTAPTTTVPLEIRPRPGAEPEATAELLGAHRDAGPLVADLSQDLSCWSSAEPLVVRLTAEADRLTGRSGSAAAEPGAVPAIVRARDLAMAQRRLMGTLASSSSSSSSSPPSASASSSASVAGPAVGRSLVRVRALVAELAELRD